MESTWYPLISLLDNRLNFWKHKYMSLRDIVVLFNSVFNVNPIFFLSFLKMPTMVWKKIVDFYKKYFLGGKECIQDSLCELG